MFIKRKNKAGKVYTYQILLSFETSVTYKKLLTSRQILVSVMRQFSSDITRKLVPGANIQPRYLLNHSIKIKLATDAGNNRNEI